MCVLSCREIKRVVLDLQSSVVIVIVITIVALNPLVDTIISVSRVKISRYDRSISENILSQRCSTAYVVFCYHDFVTIIFKHV